MIVVSVGRGDQAFRVGHIGSGEKQAVKVLEIILKKKIKKQNRLYTNATTSNF